MRRWWTVLHRRSGRTCQLLRFPLHQPPAGPPLPRGRGLLVGGLDFAAPNPLKWLGRAPAIRPRRTICPSPPQPAPILQPSPPHGEGARPGDPSGGGVDGRAGSHRDRHLCAGPPAGTASAKPDNGCLPTPPQKRTSRSVPLPQACTTLPSCTRRQPGRSAPPPHPRRETGRGGEAVSGDMRFSACPLDPANRGHALKCMSPRPRPTPCQSGQSRLLAPPSRKAVSRGAFQVGKLPAAANRPIVPPGASARGRAAFQTEEGNYGAIRTRADRTARHLAPTG